MPQFVNQQILDDYLAQFGYLGSRPQNDFSAPIVSINVEKKQAQAEFEKQQAKEHSIQESPSRVRQGITLILFVLLATGITVATVSTGLGLLAAGGIGAGAGFVGLSYADPSLSWSLSKTAALLPFRTVGAAGSLLLSRLFSNKEIENVKPSKPGAVPKPTFEIVDESELDILNLPSPSNTVPYNPNPDMYDESKSIFDMKL